MSLLTTKTMSDAVRSTIATAARPSRLAPSRASRSGTLFMSLAPFVALVTHRFSTKTRRGFNDQRYPWSRTRASPPTRPPRHSRCRSFAVQELESLEHRQHVRLERQPDRRQEPFEELRVVGEPGSAACDRPHLHPTQTHRRRTTTARHERQSYGARPAPGLDHPSRSTTRLEPAARSDPVRGRPAQQLWRAWVRR